jgi:dTDP-4-dehydrorhamnose 3,5-epimerase
MKFIETGFKDLYLIEVHLLKDERGTFARIYCKDEFSKINFTKEFVQMNFSFNKAKGTFRGLHFQLPPFEETKLIRCSSGKVFDIALDLRKDSATYLKWFSCELSQENRTMVLIPEGFAHGFITLEVNSELAYCHTEFYHPSAERGIRYNDELLDIKLPIDITCISEKDKNYPPLNSTLN